MKLKVGLCGYGGLGHMHAGNLIHMPDVELVAVCDKRPEQLTSAEVKTNLDGGGKPSDIAGCRTYTDFRKMLKKEKLDLVVTALPTDLHAKFAILAMNAGCHVFSEKPMALTLKECDRMIAARDANNRELLIGQCLRFWPEYEFLKEAIEKKTYGKLNSLIMERIGGYAGWSSENWFNDHQRSGGAILDLHLHDADWVRYAMGKPAGVFAAGVIGKTGGYDDVTSVWDYPDGATVTQRGSWMYSGFTMNFRALFEKAVIDYGFQPDQSLQVINLADGKREKPALSTSSAYLNEMQYLVECIQGKRPNERCTAESTRDSIEMIMLEIKSARKRKRLVMA